MNILNRKLTLVGMAVAVAFAFQLAITVASAEDMKPMKGGEHQTMLGITTKQQADALQADDTMAMVCAKCKTVWITRVKKGLKGAELMTANGQTTELIGTHGCKGCKSTITVVGHAKGDITELKHSCGACGDDSAFCCATKHGAGATKGMDKAKK